MLLRTFKISRTSTLLLGAMLSFALTACFENNLTNFGGVAGSSNALSFSGSTFVISNVIITPPGSTSSSSDFTTNVFFNTTQSTTSISNECSTSTSSGGTNACYCLFSWTQTIGSSQPIQRAVQTTVTNVQPNLVTCLAPQVYQTIPNNTTVQVTVQAAPGNAASFQVTPFNSVTNSSATGGSFQDAQGDSFQNILRYTCYEEYTRGMSIASQLFTSTNSQSGATATYPRADALCLQKASATSTTASTNCTGQLGATNFTSQANYYNLFIPQTDVGDINLGNDRYKCPQVQESLAAGGQTVTPGKNWPLDSQFALMVSPSATFSIGVEAFTAVSAGGDPVSAGSACFSAGSTTTSGSSGTTDNASLVKGCLGYAMPPNPTGTCPSFTNASNQIQFTYRLRRYVMMYPPIFDTDGTRLAQTQATDTVYVLDRPVSSPQSPTQPYTMKGPKPCPFAYYDVKGVAGPEDDLYSNSREVIDTGGIRFFLPGYRATNNASWNMTNVDGIAFPNIDSVNSCSAAITVIGAGGANMSIATINNSNPAFKQLYVRPVTPWAPHYEEDTDFQACAPESSTFQDPPLHFAKDPSGNISWCAEVYPTQNPNVTLANGSLDFLPPNTPTYVGHVQNFTSHVVKNSASAQVAATIPSLPGPLASPGYPAADVATCPVYPATTPVATLTTHTGLARHPSDLVVAHSNTFNGSATITTNLCAPQTADRTVETASLDWTKFPLLAPSDDVETALRADPSYNCTISYDNNGPKTGKTTPTGGCCGSVVFMKTGTSVTGALDAHLEPDVTCAIPTY
jgi:hypothetical protein